MYALFEEAGKFHAGRVLSEAEASAQVELETGKRVKVKSANLLLKFDKPDPQALMKRAQEIAGDIELQLAWEFAPEDEFGFADLAREYFSDKATPEQQAAALLRLFEAPHYFRRSGRGRFRKAPADVVEQALAAIEKKRLVQQQIDAWAAELAAGRCPPPIREQLYRILFKPDKNAPEYKAVVEAARATQLAPLALLKKAGAIDSPYQFHLRRFLLEFFPRGTAFPALAAPAIEAELPLAPVQAWSIDDSSTTEIDDALSVQGLGTGTVTLGIHIAAPALALAPGSPLDALARTRLSTVYMPGWKITMLPDDVVQAYTLQEGRACPAVSLYVRLDEATLAVQETTTRLERVPIALNLRHDQLDEAITEAWLQGANVAAPVPSPEPSHSVRPELVEGPGGSGRASTSSARTGGGPLDPRVAALREPLSFLWRLARALKAQREQVRGKPETFNRPDYNFRLLGMAEGDAPTGDERVQITVRRRGAPLDLIVAEAMILANSSWGQWLADLGVPAIYRSQASLAPGVKVRMGTRPAPHAGIGVKCYAWSTSPLRRYTDLVNQWQIVAAARHGRTAALAAPFKPKDADLFSIISSFDAAYAAYNAHQAAMERFWTLRYLRQEELAQLDATTVRDNLVRAEQLPLVFPVLGAEGLARGTRMRVRMGEPDEIALDVHGTVVERLQAQEAAALSAEDDSEAEEAVAGPLEIAVDVAAQDAQAQDA